MGDTLNASITPYGRHWGCHVTAASGTGIDHKVMLVHHREDYPTRHHAERAAVAHMKRYAEEHGLLIAHEIEHLMVARVA